MTDVRCRPKAFPAPGPSELLLTAFLLYDPSMPGHVSAISAVVDNECSTATAGYSSVGV